MAKNPSPKFVNKKHLARVEREKIQSRYITLIAVVVLTLVLGLISYGVLDQTVLLARKPVVQIGEEKITTNQFQTQVRFSRWQLIRQYESTLELMQLLGTDGANQEYFTSSLQQIESQLTDTSILGGAVLDQMISDRIIRQEAARRGITVTYAEIDDAMQEQFGFFPEGTPTPTLTPTPYSTSTLSPTQLVLVPPTSTQTTTPTPGVTQTATPTLEEVQSTASSTSVVESLTTTPEPLEGVSSPTPEPSPTAYTLEGYQGRVSELVDELEAINFDEADLRYLIESQIYTEKLREVLTEGVQSEEEQIWARHILVPDEGTAVVILAKIENGEDFSQLASEYSTDESNKNQGGDLGWFGKGRMVAEFETAAYALQVGEVSNPVQTENGYHIIQVLGREVRPLSSAQLEQAKDSEFQAWLTETMTKEDVKKFDLWEDVVPNDPTLELG